jgi:hypothetical protein
VIIFMPMLMLKCRTCGEVFGGHYVPEGSSNEFKSEAATADRLHTCSRGHSNEYAADDYMDWS